MFTRYSTIGLFCRASHCNIKNSQATYPFVWCGLWIAAGVWRPPEFQRALQSDGDRRL